MRFYGKEVRTLDNLIFYVSVKKTKYTDAIRRGNEGRKRNKTQSRASAVQHEAGEPCFWPQTRGTSFWMVLILNPETSPCEGEAACSLDGDGSKCAFPCGFTRDPKFSRNHTELTAGHCG